MHFRHLVRKLAAAAILLPLALLVNSHASDLLTRIRVADAKGDGNREALEQLVYSTIGTRVGQEISISQLSEDLKALNALPGVDSARFELEKLADGTRQITFILALKPNVVNKRIDGNTQYSSKRLLLMTKTRVGQPPEESQLAADRKAIIEKYEKAGYFGTEVTTALEDAPDGSGTVVTFHVAEQPRHKLKGVAFSGNTVFTDSQIAEVLMTRRPWWRYIFRFGNYYNAMMHPVDIERIRTLYATRGYLDCQVTEVETRWEDDEREWVTPVFHISEGRQYAMGTRHFTGNHCFTDAELEARTTIKAGEVYNATQAASDLDAMKAKYEALGYIDLQFQPELKTDRENGVVDINYAITEGDPSRIGRITISGNEDTKDRVIRRELTIYEDDLADMRKIRTSQRRLENLNYFESVTMVTKRSDSPTTRDLDIIVKEKPTGSFSVGAGFSSEDSAIGFLELSESNFSLGNLLRLEKPKGDGQHMRAYLGIGSDTQAFSLQLTEPSFLDSQFSVTGELFLNTRYEDDYDERHAGGGMMVSWPVAFQLPFFDDHIEYWDIGVGLRAEQIRISGLDDEEKFDPNDGSDPQDWPFRHGMNYALEADSGSQFTNRIILTLTRDSRNSTRFPNRGSRFTTDLEYVTRALGSYADYMKFHAGYEIFLPVYEDFFMRLSIDGFSNQHFSGDDIKVFDRYFAGGYGTIRGFKRHDVSPVNRNENSIGGNTMLVSTIEFIKPIKDVMFFKIFCDAGNVWWDEFDADLGDFNAAIGLGIQFKKIPVRLDYGYPIMTQGEHLDGRSGRLHFSIDYSF